LFKVHPWLLLFFLEKKSSYCHEYSFT